MSFADKLIPVQQFNNGNLHLVYGRSGSGKTAFLATFPNSVFISMGDKGLNTVKNYPNVSYYPFDSDAESLKNLIDELEKEPDYNQTYHFDTFGLWIDSLAGQMLKASGKKKMTLEMWGDLNVMVKQVVDKIYNLSKTKRCTISFHEDVLKAPEGYDTELAPEVSIFRNAKIAKYICGKVNYAYHTSIKTLTNQNGQPQNFFTLDVGTHPYYWIKCQVPVGTTLPEYIINPTFESIQQLTLCK